MCYNDYMEGYANWFEALIDDMTEAMLKVEKELCQGAEGCDTLRVNPTFVQSAEDRTVTEFLWLVACDSESCGLACYSDEVVGKVALDAAMAVAQASPDVNEANLL